MIVVTPDILLDAVQQVGKANPPCDPDCSGSKISGRCLGADDPTDHDEDQRCDRKKSRNKAGFSAGNGVAYLPAKEIRLRRSFNGGIRANGDRYDKKGQQNRARGADDPKRQRKRQIVAQAEAVPICAHGEERR